MSEKIHSGGACFDAPTPDRFFGLWLLNRGFIDADALKRAAALQEASNRRLGELALERGFLDRDALERLLNLQKQCDLPFGELAVRERRLTRKKLDQLLFAQTIQSLQLGEALLTLGALSPAEFSTQLAAFSVHEKNRRSLLQSFLADQPEKKRFEALGRALIRTLSRFANLDVKIDGLCDRAAPGPGDWVFHVALLLGDSGSILCRPSLPADFGAELACRTARLAVDSENPAARLTKLFTVMAEYAVQALAEQGLTATIGAVSPDTDPGPPAPALRFVSPHGGAPLLLAVRTAVGALAQ